MDNQQILQNKIHFLSSLWEKINYQWLNLQLCWIINSFIQMCKIKNTKRIENHQKEELLRSLKWNDQHNIQNMISILCKYIIYFFNSTIFLQIYISILLQEFIENENTENIFYKLYSQTSILLFYPAIHTKKSRGLAATKYEICFFLLPALIPME